MTAAAPLPRAGDFFGDFVGDLAIFFATFGIFKTFFGGAGFFAGAFFGDLSIARSNSSYWVPFIFLFRNSRNAARQFKRSVETKRSTAHFAGDFFTTFFGLRLRDKGHFVPNT